MYFTSSVVTVWTSTGNARLGDPSLGVLELEPVELALHAGPLQLHLRRQVLVLRDEDLEVRHPRDPLSVFRLNLQIIFTRRAFPGLEGRDQFAVEPPGHQRVPHLRLDLADELVAVQPRDAELRFRQDRAGADVAALE
jgi:hypothetical protein